MSDARSLALLIQTKAGHFGAPYPGGGLFAKGGRIVKI
jgi:hypothetical protein